MLSDAFRRILSAVGAFAWGPVTLCLLAGSGVYLSCLLGFPQLRRPGLVLRKTLGSLFRRESRTETGKLSPFEALAVALGGSVGTGNIAGVTGAILIGGPGAVFWMWVSAFFSIPVIQESSPALLLRSQAKTLRT